MPRACRTPPNQQDRGDRNQVGDLHRGEEHAAQEQRVQPGAPGRLQRVPARGDPPPLQPQRLDRAGTGRGRRKDLGDVGGGGALGEVAVAGPPQIPAQRTPDADQTEQAAPAEQRVQPEHRAEQEQRLHGVDEQLGPDVTQRRADRGHVGRPARRQIAGAGPLHDRRGQRQRPVDELLAHAGQRPLPEPVSHIPGPAGEYQLRQRTEQDPQRQPVDGADAVPGPHLVDDPADQPGSGESGAGRQCVECEYGDEGAGVGPYEAHHGPAYVGPFGHGEVARSCRHRTDSSASRATRAR